MLEENTAADGGENTAADGGENTADSVSEITNASLQQDLLILLAWRTDYAKQVLTFLDSKHFGGLEREFAYSIIRHIQKSGESPGASTGVLVDHLIQTEKPDDPKTKHCVFILEQLLKQKSTSESRAFCETTLAKARDYVRSQTLRDTIENVLPTLVDPQGVVSDEVVDRATKALKKAMALELHAFDPGVNFGNFDEIRNALAADNFQCMPTGIPILDKLRAGPARGGLHVLVAPAKGGKTQWETHLGVEAINDQKKVLHISLEMSRGSVVERYIQRIFNVSKHPGGKLGSQFVVDDYGRVESIGGKMFNPSYVMGENRAEFLDQLEKEHAKVYSRLGQNLRVVSFPSGSFSVDDLDALLEMYAVQEKFFPDIVLLDYPDLMRFPTRDFRLNLGRTYVEIRGIATARDLAMAVVTQANRDAAKKGDVGATSVSEDWSKVCTADTILSYSQRPEEKAIGVARLTIEASRNDASASVAITQNYACGQFVIESAFATPSFLDIVSRAGGGNSE